jgi:alanine-synthesizing transaminase
MLARRGCRWIPGETGRPGIQPFTGRFMTITPARRTRDITYAVRDIILIADEAKAAGKELLYLNIGDPNIYDFQTPAHVVEAVALAMRQNHNGYSHSSGIEEARDAIRRDAQRKGIRAIQDLFVTTGASEAIEIALSALVDAGDNVLIPAPGYPLYSALLAKLEAEQRHYLLDEDKGWQPDLADIEARIDTRTRAIVIINPNNPTGAVYSRETLAGVIDLCRRHNLVLFSDEIYDRILFHDQQHHPSASLAEDVCILTFNGLSKNFVAPGFRIGWCIVSGPGELCQEYLAAMLKLTRARLSANHPAQFGIAPALDGDQSHLARINEILERRARLTDRMLNNIPGIRCVRPGAAFYAFPSLEIQADDETFVKALIRETGVVVVHGGGFGQKPGTRHFRLVTLPDDQILERAYERIGTFLETWRRREQA